MPRPNQPRSLYAEDNLARRIGYERNARGWTYEATAAHMTEAGCPMNASAVYKIERAEKRRRIVVDELVAFARIFEIDVEDLLLPPEVAVRREFRRLLDAWQDARRDVMAAQQRVSDAHAAIGAYLRGRPDDERDGLVDVLRGLIEEAWEDEEGIPLDGDRAGYMATRFFDRFLDDGEERQRLAREVLSQISRKEDDGEHREA